MDEQMRKKFDAWFPYEPGETISMVRDVAWEAWQVSAALSQPAAADEDLSALMVKHEISVWRDPNWYPHFSVPPWLAGQKIAAVEGQYYSTLTGSDPAQIEAVNTCNGETPLLAVLAVIEALPKATP